MDNNNNNNNNNNNDEYRVKRRRFSSSSSSSDLSTQVDSFSSSSPFDNIFFLLFDILLLCSCQKKEKKKNRRRTPQNSLLSFRQVCQDWNQLLLSSIESLKFDSSFCPSSQTAWTFASQFPRLRDLSFVGYMDLTPQLFSASSTTSSSTPSSSTSSTSSSFPLNIQSLRFVACYLDDPLIEAITRCWGGSGTLLDLELQCPGLFKYTYNSFSSFLQTCGSSLRTFTCPVHCTFAKIGAEVFTSKPKHWFLSESCPSKQKQKTKTRKEEEEEEAEKEVKKDRKKGPLEELSWYFPNCAPAGEKAVIERNQQRLYLEAIIKNNPNLRVIDISNHMFGGDDIINLFGWIASNCTNLEVLKLRERSRTCLPSPDLLEAVLKKLVRNCRSLKRFESDITFTPQILFVFSSPYSKELRTLKFYWKRNDDEQVITTFARNCAANGVTQLKTFSLVDLLDRQSKFDYSVFPSLQCPERFLPEQVSRLKSLEPSWDVGPFLNSSQTFPKLTRLKFTPPIRTPWEDTVSRLCPALTHLDLHNCRLERGANCWPQTLREISVLPPLLSQPDTATDFLISVAEHCPQLRRLEFIDTARDYQRAVGDQTRGFLALSRSCKFLEVLIVTPGTVASSAFEEMASSSASKRIQQFCCLHVFTDRIAEALLNRTPPLPLKEIRISQHTLPNVDTWKRLLTRFEHLTRFWVRDEIPKSEIEELDLKFKGLALQFPRIRLLSSFIPERKKK